MNAVVWESVFQRYSVLAKTVSFLGITGTLQVEDVIDADCDHVCCVSHVIVMQPEGTPDEDFVKDHPSIFILFAGSSPKRVLD